MHAGSLESAAPFAVSVNCGSSNEITNSSGTVILSAVGVYVRGEITQEEPAEWGPDMKLASLTCLSPTNKASTDNADMMSAVVKLTREIEESSLDVIGYGRVFHSMTSSRDTVWRAALSSLSWPAECVMQVDAVPSKRRLIA